MTKGWTAVRLKHLVTVVNEKAGPMEDRPYVGLDAIAPWTGQIDLSASEATDGATGNRFNSGDVLFGKLRPYLAKVALPNFAGQCSGEAIVIRPKKTIDPRFIRYMLVDAATIDAINASTFGAKMPRASWYFIGNVRFSVPDRSTQTAIADFLDRETVSIDQLIEKKQRLVELLTEKTGRQTAALLESTNHEVPSRSIRWLVRVRSGDFISNEEIEMYQTPRTPFPVIGGNGVMAYGGKSNSPPGTIVVGRVGALCGNVHYTEERSWVTDNALIVRVISKEVDPAFLVEVLKAANLNEMASKSAQPLITGEAVKALKVRLPDRRRQAEICTLISSLADENQRLLGFIDSSIDRLREFRSALITAAVTGQIDVKTWDDRGETDRRLDKIQEDMTAGQESQTLTAPV